MDQDKQLNNGSDNDSDNDNLVRLNRFLAMAGAGSRRGCDNFILEGRVTVNGEQVIRLGMRIDPARDEVLLDGKPVLAVRDMIYVLMNKPLRTITTTRDERKRRTVMDLVSTDQRLFPVGRLDYNTTGALLITNDGELSYFLIHPRFEIKKIYHVMLNKVIRPIDLHHFQKGIMLDDRMTSPCKAREMRRMGNRSFLEVEIHEGRNRQIRRMFEILGYNVEKLHRQIFGGLEVNGLNTGEWRQLSSDEVRLLKQVVDDQREKITESGPAGS